MNHTPTTFRPPWWRCFLSSVLPALLGALTAAFTLVVIENRPVSSLDDLFVFVSISALFHLLTTSRTQDQMTITVSDGSIVRLAKGGDWGWARIQFPIDKVDCERTRRKPTMRQRLFSLRYRYLWSTNGHKIPIDYWAFTPAQATALLTLIGCDEEQGA